MMSSTPMSPAARLRGVSGDSAGAWLHRRAGRQRRQDPAGCQRAHDALRSTCPITSARPPTRSSRRSSTSRTSAPRSWCRSCGPLIPQYGHLAAYPPSNILIISDRASNVNRIDAHHPAHRPGRRPGRRDHAAAERLGARRSCASSTRCIRAQAAAAEGGAPDQGRRRRALQQRADQRRPVAAPAHQDAGRAPGHAARARRRHAGASTCTSPTPRRSRRSSRSRSPGIAAGAAAAAALRGAAATSAGAARRRTPRSGPTRRPTR